MSCDWYKLRQVETLIGSIIKGFPWINVSIIKYKVNIAFQIYSYPFINPFIHLTKKKVSVYVLLWNICLLTLSIYSKKKKKSNLFCHPSNLPCVRKSNKKVNIYIYICVIFKEREILNEA